MNKTEILEQIGDPEEISSQLEGRTRDANFFRDNYGALQEEYPDEWVAIFNEDIVGHHKTYRELLKFLRERRILRAYVEKTYVKREPPTLIFPAV
jgi:hypothetical protein